MHNIDYFTYKENTNKRDMEREALNYIAENGEYGGEYIRWNDNIICENRAKAEEWISMNDKGWYDQLAVRFYHHIPPKTKKLKELDEKVQKAYSEYRQKDNANYIKTRTSEFIGCSKCKSRMNSHYLSGNFCPICRSDLRPESTLKSITAAQNKWKNAQKERENYINDHGTKEINWLVKIEYHT